jgi:hypothetical protein
MSFSRSWGLCCGDCIALVASLPLQDAIQLSKELEVESELQVGGGLLELF